MPADRFTVRRVVMLNGSRRYRVRDRDQPLTLTMSYAKARRLADDLNDGELRRHHVTAVRAEIDATRTARMKVNRPS